MALQQERQAADVQAKRIATCDGSSPALVRDWLDEVEISTKYCNKTVYVAAHSSSGPLRRELERFLDSKPDRAAVTWEILRPHLEAAFLTPLEQDRLRYELAELTQKEGEPIASFNRRFVDLADRAYPKPAAAGQQRNEDQKRILLHHYIRGLAEDDLAEKLVTHGHPSDMEEAMTLIMGYAKDTQQLRMARRGRLLFGARVEEPMEIGAVSQAAAPWKPALDDVNRKVEGVAKQVTKMIAMWEKEERPQQRAPRRGAPQPNSRPGNRLQFTDDGSPICLYCNREGHVAKQCRTKRAHREAREQGSSGYYNQGGR